MSLQKQKTVAIIPARGGSKGLKKKNIQLLAGKPLIACSIEQVKAVELVDKIIVSTDDPDIREVAMQSGAEVPFLRPDDLAQDTSKTDEVLQHAVQWLDQNVFRYDIVLWCHATLPFRKSEWLRQIILNLIHYPEIDSSFLVCATHKNYWVEVEAKLVPLSFDGKHPGFTQRQKKKPVFQEECGLGCATRADVVRQGQRIGGKMLPYKIYEHLAAFDIHDEFDLWLADMIYRKLSGNIFGENREI